MKFTSMLRNNISDILRFQDPHCSVDYKRSHVRRHNVPQHSSLSHAIFVIKTWHHIPTVQCLVSKNLEKSKSNVCYKGHNLQLPATKPTPHITIAMANKTILRSTMLPDLNNDGV